VAGIPSKAVLAARTDQALAMAKDMSSGLDSRTAALTAVVAELLAAEFQDREETAARAILAAAAIAVTAAQETGVDPVSCMVLAAAHMVWEAGRRAGLVTTPPGACLELRPARAAHPPGASRTGCNE
jgi:hypothetical protein